MTTLFVLLIGFTCLSILALSVLEKHESDDSYSLPTIVVCMLGFAIGYSLTTLTVIAFIIVLIR